MFYKIYAEIIIQYQYQENRTENRTYSATTWFSRIVDGFDQTNWTLIIFFIHFRAHPVLIIILRNYRYVIALSRFRKLKKLISIY